MISFLLLLMAAAACCAPNSPQVSQPNECSAFAHDPNVQIIKGKVTCKLPSIFQLFYKTTNGPNSKADEITCNDRQWVAKLGHDSQKVKPTSVWCVWNWGSIATQF